MTTLQADSGAASGQDTAFQVCINPDCRATYSVSETLVGCTKCGSLLDIEYDWDRLELPKSLRDFEARWSTRQNPLDFSGVWRFRNLLPFAPESSIVTIGEGQTMLPANASPVTSA